MGNKGHTYVQLEMGGLFNFKRKKDITHTHNTNWALHCRPKTWCLRHDVAYSYKRKYIRKCQVKRQERNKWNLTLVFASFLLSPPRADIGCMSSSKVTTT